MYHRIERLRGVPAMGTKFSSGRPESTGHKNGQRIHRTLQSAWVRRTASVEGSHEQSRAKATEKVEAKGWGSAPGGPPGPTAVKTHHPRCRHLRRRKGEGWNLGWGLEEGWGQKGGGGRSRQGRHLHTGRRCGGRTVVRHHDAHRHRARQEDAGKEAGRGAQVPHQEGNCRLATVAETNSTSTQSGTNLSALRSFFYTKNHLY